MPRDYKTKRDLDQSKRDVEGLRLSDISDVTLPVSSINTVHPQVLASWIWKTHDGDTDWTMVEEIPIYCSGVSGSLGLYARIRNRDASGTTSLRLEISGDGGGAEISTTGTSWSWETSASDYDVSGYSGWQVCQIQIKTSNAAMVAEVGGIGMRWK